MSEVRIENNVFHGDKPERIDVRWADGTADVRGNTISGKQEVDVGSLALPSSETFELVSYGTL